MQELYTIVEHLHLGGVGEELQLDKMAAFLESSFLGKLTGPGLILGHAVGPGLLQIETLELGGHVSRQKLLS